MYIGGIGYRSTQGIEGTQLHYPPAEWVNAANAARHIKSHSGSHVFVDKEALLKLTPQVIFIDGGGLTLFAEDVARRPEYYKTLKAFADRRVYLLHPFNWYTTNIATALTDAYAIGRILYPDRFEDIDPEAKADEIYEELAGRPVYKEMKADYGPIGKVPSFID